MVVFACLFWRGRGSRFSLRACVCSALGYWIVAASLPAADTDFAGGYYAGVAELRGEALRTELGSRIGGHRRYNYTELWGALKDLYRDPSDSGRIILFYSQASWDARMQDPGTGSEQYWNREHLWPVSLGGGGSSNSSPQYSDLFHVVPANKRVNNRRGNKWFDDSDPAAPGYNPLPDPIAADCSATTVSWEPGDGQKGWVARSMFYMITRYANLKLVDVPAEAAPTNGSDSMAQGSTLLRWNRRYLPAAKEREINDRVFTDYQRNRNPFIDVPEFADAILVAGPSWGDWRLRHFSLSELRDPAISGDFADPDGDGIANLLERALYSDPRMAAAETIRWVESPSGEYGLTFIRAAAVADLLVTLHLEASEDLATWTEVSLDGAELELLDAHRQQVRLPVFMVPQTARFFRLRATLP